MIQTAGGPGPVVITDPQWISKPNGEQLRRAYPARALNAGTTHCNAWCGPMDG